MSDTGLLYNAINNMAPPIGSLMTIADSLTPVAVSGIFEYLQTGILTAIAPYPNLEAIAPWITANLGTSSGTAMPVASQSLRGVGGRWYSFGSGQSQMMTGITGTWAAQTTDTYTGQGDVCIFGTKIIRSKNGLNGFFVHTPSGVIPGSGQTNTGANVVVTNPTFTKVIGGLTSSNVYSSTDGETYTVSTPTGVSGSITAGDWCSALNAYLFINSVGRVFTSTDGIAYTDRGLVNASVTGFAVAPVIYSDCKAGSATSNIFIHNLTVGGVTEPYVVRTTGTTHTITKMTTVFNLNANQTATNDVRLTYIGKFICIVNAKSGDPSSICYQSTDDGITWSKMSLPINPTNTASPIRQLISGNSIIVSATDDANKLVAVHSGTIATHAGVTLKSTNITSGGATFSNYMRIK